MGNMIIRVLISEREEGESVRERRCDSTEVDIREMPLLEGVTRHGMWAAPRRGWERQGMASLLAWPERTQPC